MVALSAAVACAPAFAQTGAKPPRASVSDTPTPGVIRVAQQPQQYDGHPIALIFFDLYGSTGRDAGDRDLRRRIERLASPIGDGRFTCFSPIARSPRSDRCRACATPRMRSF